MTMFMFLLMAGGAIFAFSKRCEWFKLCDGPNEEQMNRMLSNSVIMPGDRKKYGTPAPTYIHEKGAQDAGDLMAKVINSQKDWISGKKNANNYVPSAKYSSLYGTDRINYF